MFGVEGVAPADGCEGWAVELEDEGSAAWSEDAGEFGECFEGLGDIADAEGDGEDIERVVVVGEGHGVALGVGDLGLAFGGGLGAGDVEHLGGEVEAYDGPRACCGECSGEVACAAGDIEDIVEWVALSVFAEVGEFDGAFAPGLV